MSVSFNAAIGDLFDDPISFQRMTDPVISTVCGHTFEKVQIEGWIEHCENNNEEPSCPICKERINKLVPNWLAKQALDILNNPSNALINRVTDLTSDEDQETIQRAISSIQERRATDETNGISSRLEEPFNFVKKAITDCSRYYSC